ncbi:hypothetical protein CANARDRAFT_29153 [[Candida] arabinofermentans NRRL YB-2248]|uniref:Rho termination factor N-terminal domain-containing protein n=1 Tax=[Candida] arabinofermentans NRRL YB-2248 TaxID=983967 RepID=A0A1E4SYQ9_9ASCO|nr:hypothetical protein CANARDRAFT_29153 [[Candida] arabinofermentans NRRL YB-2248]
MSLTHKTKIQLTDIADDLNIDVSDCKFKKDIAERLSAFFVEHAFSFPEDSKYYDFAKYAAGGASKQSSPIKSKKKVTIDDSPIGILEDESVDEAEVEVATGSGDEDEEAEVEAEAEAESEEAEASESDEPKGSAVSLACTKLKVFKSKFNCEAISDYIETKNFEIREELSDPFTINTITLILQTLYLSTYFYETTTVKSASFVPQLIADNLKDYTIVDLAVLIKPSFLSTFALWFLASYLVPKAVSFYVNFTYDFEFDPFIHSLTKLLATLILFKLEINASDIQSEIAFQFTKSSFSYGFLVKYARHLALQSLVLLRGAFGNWVLIEAVFSSIVAIYANLSFI